jgi:lysylphosphatidylglycerol synthetase-like protein (DUF2156 family)
MVDLMQILSMAAPILPAILGPAAALTANAVEKTPVIPYQARSISTIVLAVFLSSLAICVIAAGATGRLTGDWEGILRLLIESIVTTLAGCGAYSLSQARKPLI